MRRMLFNPTEADMGTYARLIPGATELNAEGPEQPVAGKASTPFLSLLYLYHSHNPETAKTFVLAGGLLALAKVVHATNIYVRGQTLEILTQLTGTIDWFAETPAGEDQLAAMSLHRQMLGLIQSRFLHDLLDNQTEPAGQQQGAMPFTALRIVAFWLSWVRFTFCRQLGPQGMVVSASVLERLRGFINKPGGTAEDHELAQKVADDFGGVEATEHEGPWGSGLTVHQDCSTAARESGNEVFKQGRCMTAAAHYSMAIDLNPQDSANYTNRAAALLKFSANCDGEEKAGMLQRVVRDCSAALQLGSGNLKAHFRKSKALVMLANGTTDLSKQDEAWADAAASIEIALESCPGDADLEKLMAAVREKKMVIEVQAEIDRQAANQALEDDAAATAAETVATEAAPAEHQQEEAVAPLEQPAVDAASPTVEVLDKAALMSLE